MMGFVFKMMCFALKMMDFVFSLAALRVYNPIGAVTVRELTAAQLTIDTAAGVGDVAVEDVTAAAARIFAGKGSVLVSNTRLQVTLH